MTIKRVMAAGARVAVIVIASLAAMGQAAAGDAQLRFDVREPFEIGGHVFTSGLITVERVSSFTPTTTILEVWVDGYCLGMMSARNVAAEAPSERNQALFRRGASGRLVMIGYQAAGRTSGGAFRFVEAPDATIAAGAPAPSGAPSTVASAAVVGTH